MHDTQALIREAEELLTKLAEPGLDNQDRARLAELLNRSPEVVELYLDHIEMEAMLSETYGLLNRSFSSTVSSTLKRKPSRRPRWRAFATSAILVTSLACAIIGFMLGASLRNTSIGSPLISNSPPHVAPRVPAEASVRDQSTQRADETEILCQITHRTKAIVQQLTGSSFREVSVPALTAGQYRLEDGNLELRYAHEARVVLQSPASFRLLSDKHLYLEEGRASVNCPTPASKGFVVETPSGVATDLGTEFSIDVNSFGLKKDEFHVFDGEVSLRSKLYPYEFKLIEGQATQLDHETSTPAGIDPDYQRFIRSFEASSDEYHELINSLHPTVYYAMSDDGDGNTIYNETQDLYHGVVVKSEHNDQSQHLDHWASGFNGGTSFRMDGMKSQIYAVVPDYPKTQSDELTVTAWIYAESRPNWGSIAKNWGHNSDPTSRGQFHFGLYAFSGCLEASINDKDDQEVFAIDTESLPLARWHHVALTVTSTSLKLFRNGSMVASAACNGLNGSPDIRPLAIGTKLGNNSFDPAVRNNGFWDGRIDHLAIFNRSLSDAEIENLYQVGRKSAFLAPRE